MKSDKIYKFIFRTLLVLALWSGSIAPQIEAIAKQENITWEAPPKELEEHLNTRDSDPKMPPRKFVNQIKIEPNPPRSNDPVQGDCDVKNQCRSKSTRK
jgi:hypothetical protein